MGLKFLKNALKDADLYQDALSELLEAEKLMHSDYFVLHRIGMIYLYVPNFLDLEKASQYFTRAGKYAAVESDPGAIRLSNILNKSATKKFSKQADASGNELSDLAGESYLQAGTALYALGRFDEAIQTLERAVKCQPNIAKHRFFLAKNLVRINNPEAAVQQLRACIELIPEMALAAIADYDLNVSQPILDLLEQMDSETNARIRDGISALKKWNEGGYLYVEVLQLLTEADNTLNKGDFPTRYKIALTIGNWVDKWKLFLPVFDQINKLAAYGLPFQAEKAAQLLRENDIDKVWAAINQRYVKGYSDQGRMNGHKLNEVAARYEHSFVDLVLLATVEDSLLELWDEYRIIWAVDVCCHRGFASISVLQMQMKFGYCESLEFLPILEHFTIIGPEKEVDFAGCKLGQRDILVEYKPNILVSWEKVLRDKDEDGLGPKERFYQAFGSENTAEVRKLLARSNPHKLMKGWGWRPARPKQDRDEEARQEEQLEKQEKFLKKLQKENYLVEQQRRERSQREWEAMKKSIKKLLLLPFHAIGGILNTFTERLNRFNERNNAKRIEHASFLRQKECSHIKNSNRLVVGVCAIIFGFLGVHKFILGFIEGIISLTKSDEDFINRYVEEKRGWF